MADGQVVFEITGDDRPINQSVRDVTDTIRRESRNWDNAVSDSTENMTQAMNKAFDVNRIKTWALQAAKAVLDFGRQAVEAASDLSEVQNVVDTTFGDNATVIDSWAKNAIQQFGLTETQAKKFASTMGAMMKSAGLSGSSIVSMSTDLAGLAADMSSFYNLDFETSFNKLRAGLTGETEPLKQLGINMSAANLEAFALQQGLNKTYKEMSQSEQIMLRYQYIMQATADAQGDFANTADGFANGTRLLQSNIEALKTNIGGLIEGPLANLIAGINSLFSNNHTRTVLDDFADIDAETEQRLAQIGETVDTANALTIVLDEIQQKTGSAVSGLASAVGNVPAIDDNTVENAGDLADSLERMEKVEIKQNRLQIADISQAKVEHYNGMSESMSSIAESVEKLDQSSFTENSAPVKAAEKLATKIKDGQDNIVKLNQSLSDMNTSQAEEKTKALADAVEPVAERTEAASNASEEWLTACGKLVQTLPGLSTIINTQTGEIEGGTDAVREYVRQWGEIQTKMANIDRLQKYETVLAENKEKEDDYYIDAAKKYQLMKINAEKYIEWAKSKGQWWDTKEEAKAWLAKEAGVDISEITDEVYYNYAALQGSFNGQYKDRKKLNELMNDAGEAKRIYEDNVQANKEAAEAVSAYREDQEKELTDEERSIIIHEKAQTALKDLTDQYNDAQAAMEEYRKNAIEETLKSVNQLISGFNKIEMPKGEDAPTMYGMKQGLDSQLKFMQDYRKNLEIAKQYNLDEGLLAELSDGSKESAAYLAAIAAEPEKIAEINEAYKAVNDEKEKFAETLTDNKLAMDEAYDALETTVEDAKTRMTQANDIIVEKLGNSPAEIAEKMNGHLSEVQTAVDNLNAILGGINMPTIYIPWGTSENGNSVPGFATGLENVPWDNFLARLHAGEGILTAEENRVWKGLKHGTGVDYDQLGSVMRDNVKAGGDVYLDGRTVGHVISDIQGNQYRNLQRSGWQS